MAGTSAKLAAVARPTYKGANGGYKNRHIGLFDTQEPPRRARMAATRRAGLEGRRKTNPVVDGRTARTPRDT